MSVVMGAGENFGDRLTSPFADGAVVSVHRKGRIPAHTHSSSYICFVLAGSLIDKHLCPGATLEPGDAIVYPGGEIHDNEFLSRRVICLNLHRDSGAVPFPFQRRRLGLRARRLGIEMALNLVSGPVDRLTHETLLAEFEELMCDGRLKATGEPRLHQIMTLLADEPARDWALADLAARVGYHPTHLARAFRNATGMTVGAWRRRHRALRVCADLRVSREELAQLAYRYGFSDQAHMTREVRFHTGLTPLAMRRM
jgi:AraC-like DNA-binding protein